MQGNREELATLVKNTTLPGRKLQLWGVYHKAHVVADVQRDHAGSDPESQRMHAARVTAASDTLGEVDEEMAFMYQRAGMTGKPFTAADVDALIERKDAEHAMEMKYGINFTTDGGARANGTHMDWSKAELDTIDKTLSPMPADHRSAVTEFHRQEHVYWDAAKTQEIGAEATGTKVLMPDQATSTGPWAGEHRQMAAPALGSNISWMEWVTTHELGHIVSNKYAALEQKYEQINGWQSYDQGTPNLTAADKATLDAKRNNRFDNRATVDKDGKTYEIDQSGPGYISHTQGSLPGPGEAVPMDDGTADPWSYAETRGYEQFAEHYDRAIHVPEKVYKDMVENPHLATQRAQQALAAATTDADRQKAQQALDAALRVENVRKQSYDLMRNDVFGTDKAQAAAEARLAARGVDPAKIAVFRERAAAASTPEQIDVLEKTF
ncbi:MAG: hypothetical protein ACM31C_30855 [Acidobacteriota bacterium]